MNKTIGEQEKSFGNINVLFSEQEGIFAKNKIYNGEAFNRLEKYVKEACKLCTKIKSSVDELKSHKKKIDDTSQIGWEEISLSSKREEEVEHQQVDRKAFYMIAAYGNNIFLEH